MPTCWRTSTAESQSPTAHVLSPRLRWHIARKSECTAQCGLGYRTLEIYCSKYSRLEGKIEKVDDRFCSSQPKPSTREKCTGDCNVGGWRYSAWTEVRSAWCCTGIRQAVQLANRVCMSQREWHNSLVTEKQQYLYWYKIVIEV